MKGFESTTPANQVFKMLKREHGQNTNLTEEKQQSLIDTLENIEEIAAEANVDTSTICLEPKYANAISVGSSVLDILKQKIGNNLTLPSSRSDHEISEDLDTFQTGIEILVSYLKEARRDCKNCLNKNCPIRESENNSKKTEVFKPQITLLTDVQ